MFPFEFLNIFTFDRKPSNRASKQAILELNPFTPSKVIPMQDSMGIRVKRSLEEAPSLNISLPQALR